MRWTTWTEYIVGTVVCILVLLGIRWVFRKKINPNVQYFLWILVAMRILLPVHFQVVLPQTEWMERLETVWTQSIWTERLEAALGQSQRAESPEAIMTAGDRQNGSETFPEAESKPTVGAIHLPLEPEEEYVGTFLPLVPELQEIVEVKTENQQGISLWLFPWLRGLWLIGMVVFALFLGIRNIHWYRRIRGIRRRVGTLGHGLPLYEAEGMNCLWGCFRPAIYLSPEVLATEERKAHVLQHELEHYRAKDHIWVLVRTLCLLVQWYNPLVWLAYYEAGKDCETACDYRVTKQMNRQERIAYGESLLWVVENSVMKKRSIYPAASMGEDKKLLAKRLQDVVKNNPKKMVVLPCVVLGIVVEGLFMTMTVEKQAKKETISNQGSMQEGTKAQGSPEELGRVSKILSFSGDSCILYIPPEGMEDYRILYCLPKEERFYEAEVDSILENSRFVRQLPDVRENNELPGEFVRFVDFQYMPTKENSGDYLVCAEYQKAGENFYDLRLYTGHIGWAEPEYEVMELLNERYGQVEKMPELLSLNEELKEMWEQVKAARKYLHMFPKEDVVVIPQVKEYTYEEAAALGEVQEYRSFLPGAAEGSWYIITIDGICYFYGKYDHRPQEESPALMGASYAIVGEQYSLANGLKVGMTEQEVLERYPNMEVVDFENQPVYKERKIWGCMGWNNGHYPDGVEVSDGTSQYSWLKQFDYIMIGDVDQGSYDTLPVYVGLLIKDKVVQAITFQSPTAG